MANRAYLYSHPRPAFEKLEAGVPELYYDSRHSIPIGWFFFFRLQNIAMIDVENWQEVKFIALKESALALFDSRRPLLDRYLSGGLLLTATTTLIKHLREWPGEYLLMDPVEVVDDDQIQKSQFESIIKSIDSSRPDRIDAAMHAYDVRLPDDPEARMRRIIGYTYWE